MTSLELCIHDLVYPTEKSEALLETLSNEELSLIEEAVNKIKSKKIRGICISWMQNKKIFLLIPCNRRKRTTTAKCI